MTERQVEKLALCIVNTYSEFQVNIFGNNRDITKCESFSIIHVNYISENWNFARNPLFP